MKKPKDYRQAHEQARINAIKTLGLHEKNTAMDRAKAMGFDEAYHGTNEDIEKFSTEHAGKKTGNPNTGFGISVATNPKEASRYTTDFGIKGSPNVMPLMVRKGKVYDMPYSELNEAAMGLFNAPGSNTRERFTNAQKAARKRAKELQSEGHDTIRAFTGKPHEEVFVPDPSRIRSRFAAFDPHRAHENDLLAAKGGSVKKSIDEMKAALANAPQKTVKAYKLFKVHPKHPGKLFPLYVDSNTPVEMNKWVDAKSGEMASGKVKSSLGPLAYRPGWHAGDLPMATHIGEKEPGAKKPTHRPEHHAWAEVEMPHDVDWQSEANKRGTNAKGKLVPVKAHITDQIPVGGHYRYKTNPNMSGNWLIGGSMKVNKVLTDDEVSRINKKAGVADLPRTKPFNKKEYGFAAGGNVQGNAMPSIAQMKMALSRNLDLRNMGVNQAIGSRAYSNPDPKDNGLPPVGGVSDSGGLPVGGVDTDSTVPGQQMTPQAPNQPTQPFPPAQGGMQPPMTMGIQQQPPAMGNMLSMTPQGQTLDALAPAGMPGKAEGGSMPVYTHHVVDPQDNHRIMGKYQSASTARKARDRLDNQYGAYRYKVTMIPQAKEAMIEAKKRGGQVNYDKGGSAREELTVEVNKYKPTATKASEALGKHEGKHLKVTQSDRTKVGEGYLGGPGFSSLQHVDPRYAGMAWGVNSKGAASKIANQAAKNAIWSTLIGAPEQHSSNQMVFDRLLKHFKSGIKSGKLSPELRAKINQKIQESKMFDEGSDIASSNFFKNLSTFDQRRIMADLMGGKQVGGKKGQIFDYDKIMHETTEPELVGAPTHAIGPRLFSLTKERSIKPELHPAFPHILHGEDFGQMFHPVPRQVMLPDFHKTIKQSKGRDVGFMDLTRNTPSQHLTDAFLTSLQKQGYKKGGKTSRDVMKLELSKKKVK
jgi:hypothetical protein